MRIALLILTLLGLSTAAQAHADTPQASWWTWNSDPLLLTGLGFLAGLYGLGIHRIHSRRGVNHLLGWRITAYMGGILALVTALVSPIDALSSELSSVHMIQHMALMMVAAPLLVLGAPMMVLPRSLPNSWQMAIAHLRRQVHRWRTPGYLLWHPLVLWGLYAFTLWIWHLPALYEAALSTRWVHDVQHLAFLVSAMLFWRILLDPLRRLRLGRGLGVLYLFTTSLHATVLGVFMALAPSAWYSTYALTTPEWGLTPIEDQQLAGLIMWMPACLVYAIVAAALFALWLEEPRRTP